MTTRDFIHALPIRKLKVFRTLSTGRKIYVGQLASNRQGVFFQYDTKYLECGFNLSPFLMNFEGGVQKAPAVLHSVFEDSLPDGWGLLLMDRWLQQNNILLENVSPMDRLALLGGRAMGALSFEPCIETGVQAKGALCLEQINQQIECIYNNQSSKALEQLLAGGSAAGTRPKIQIYMQTKNTKQISLQSLDKNSQAYLLKFTHSSLPLQYEESLCEAAYLQMALQAGIECARWKLMAAPQALSPRSWLVLERFDCTAQGGRYHVQSLAALLGLNFRLPVFDYKDLIRVSSVLCNTPAAGQEQFRRAVFNLLALNHDDHSKNWSFLQNDQGQWRVAPFYDVTYSPSPHSEHMCSFAGYGKAPPLKAMQALAQQASFKNWAAAQKVIQQVEAAVASWPQVAKSLGVSAKRRALIQKQLQLVRQQNKSWLGK